MAERALSEEAMLAGLRDIHLPAEVAGGSLAELLAAVGIGLVLAALLGFALRLVTERPARHLNDPPPDTLTRLEALHLLRARRPERFAELRPLLYRPGGRPGRDEVLKDLGRDD